MGEIRLNPITGDPVILSTTRADRPGAWSEDAQREGRESCPFCPGHESETPSEIERNGTQDHWTTRAVPNKYPAIFHPSTAPHEVLIDSPEHDLAFENMGLDHLQASIELWRRRAQAQAGEPGCRYVSVFRNDGRAAGQSIAHPHSQLLALDFVPTRIRRELEGFLAGPCPMCSLVAAESRRGEMVIDESGPLLLISPRAARIPFETWIVDPRHLPDWSSADPRDLARLLLSAVGRIRGIHPGAAFNIGLITAPLRTDGSERFHWYAEVTPRLTSLAGYEMSTGGWINIESPERAAERLRACAVRRD